MSKNTLIFLLVVLIIGVGGFLLWKQMNPTGPTSTTTIIQTPGQPAAGGPTTVVETQLVMQTVTEAMQPQGQKVEVKIQNFKYDPAEVKIKKGETVTWTNEDTVPHTVTALDGSFDSKTLSQGQTFSFTFDKAGSFEYKCTVHPSMPHGTVVVEE